MDFRSLQDHLRKEPFRPLKFYLSDGSTYEVRHPEMVAVSRVEVAIVTQVAEDGVGDRMVYADPVHITRLEPIDEPVTQAATSDKNGDGR